MKRFIFVLVALSCLATIAQANWQSRDSNYNVSISGAPAFQGPGDIISGATIYYGFQCYNAAYTGNVADITDSATGNTTGTRLQCNNGVISALVSGSACTFVTGNACSPLATTCSTACNVEKLYDQSGAHACTGSTPCDLSQATNSSRPTFLAGCVNSLPCMKTVTSDLTSGGNTLTTLAQPFTSSIVAGRTGNFTNHNIILVEGGQVVSWYFNNTNNSVEELAGTLVNFTNAGACPDNTVISYHGIINGASSALVCGGTASGALNAGTATWSAGVVHIGSDGIATNPCTCTITVAGMWPIAFDSTQYNAMHALYQSYWAVP